MTCTAEAPASVGNVAVGFDLIGHAILGVHDRVSITRQGKPGIRVTAVRGVVDSLPVETEKNTAAAAINSLLNHCDPGCRDVGIELILDKGIPLASGMGGSAASAVAAVVALNHMLDNAFTRQELYRAALDGESVASGSRHGDNVAPSLFGGLCMALPEFTRAVDSSEQSMPAEQVIALPVQAGLHAVLVHPHAMIRTEQARSVLSDSIDLKTALHQQALLSAFISACYCGDMELLAASLRDLIVEPQRAALVPAFYEIKQAALAAGAMGCSISGAGPSVFAWADTEEKARQIEVSMCQVLQEQKLGHESYISPVSAPGARVIDATDAQATAALKEAE